MTKTGRAFPFQQSCSPHLAEIVRNPGVPFMGARAIDRELPSSPAVTAPFSMCFPARTRKGLDVSQFCLC